LAESPKKDLGKLLSIHGASPVYMQRAAIVAVLSFIFFLAMLAVFSFRRQIGYFILSTAFLVVEVFTLLGLFSHRRNILEIRENGLKYKKRFVSWDEIDSVTSSKDSGVEVILKDTGKILIPPSLHDLENARRMITANLRRETSA
jgi:hypothetical protein